MKRITKDLAAARQASEPMQARVKRENEAHTPGPWTLQISLDGVHVIGPKPSAIQGLREADARLIAEAPSLLDALIYLRDCAESGDLPSPERWKQVRAAIQKATGDTP